MELFGPFSLVLVVAALFSYANHRFLRWPTTIGVMAIALGLSGVLLVAQGFGLDVHGPAERFIERLHFRELLLDGLLAFLLFAGALHVDLTQLLGQKRVIGLLATVGIVVTTALVGVAIHTVAGLFGFPMPWTVALLFGSLISPTDPIAVIGILQKAGVPKTLETKIVGESLFNDGIGVVVFSVLLGLCVPDGQALDGAGELALFFAHEVLGSFVLGGLAGWLVFRMLRSVDDYHVEVLLTLALAMGLYSLCGYLHTSGPLAVVVAGLWIGNSGRAHAMSDRTREHLDTFWELVDEILNVVLFVLIGLELVVIELAGAMLVVGMIAIPVVLLARYLSVGSTVAFLKRRRTFTPLAVEVMTWGGLRGGISVALALSIPASVPQRDLLLTMTYVVVVFSILVQGLTVGRLAARIPRAEPEG